jgi:ABC-type polysaccharide/polyol phosphate export permease
MAGEMPPSSVWDRVVLEPFRYRALVKNLVLKDLKLKYRGSVLGVAWSLLHPLLLLGVYTLAFRYIVRIQMESYAFFLLAGLLPWTFFASTLQSSTASIVGNANLLRKVYFPREILPVASVLFGFAQLLLALAVFLPVLLLFSGIAVSSLALAFFPAVLLLHLLFTIGLAFVVSAATTYFRDVPHLTEVSLVLLFWLTPVIYPVSMVPAPLAPFFAVSPLAAFAGAYQDVLFWGRLPAPATVATIVVSTLLALAGGHALFRRMSPGLAEAV